MDRNQLHRQLALMRQSFFDQGYLDEQFIQLEELQDDANPNFVEEVVTLYYRNSARLILNIEQALEKKPLDFNKLDGYMHQFKGSSSSIGAEKVKAESTLFREYCRAGDGEGCIRIFQQLKKEYTTLKKKLEAYFSWHDKPDLVRQHVASSRIHIRITAWDGRDNYGVWEKE